MFRTRKLFESLACANNLLRNKQNDQYYRALSLTALRCLDDPKYKALADYDKIVLEKNLVDNFSNTERFQNISAASRKYYYQTS